MRDRLEKGKLVVVKSSSQSIIASSPCSHAENRMRITS